MSQQGRSGNVQYVNHEITIKNSNSCQYVRPFDLIEYLLSVKTKDSNFRVVTEFRVHDIQQTSNIEKGKSPRYKSSLIMMDYASYTSLSARILVNTLRSQPRRAIGR